MSRNDAKREVARASSVLEMRALLLQELLKRTLVEKGLGHGADKP